MPYFSRLTDIVTCNLTSLLEASENPREALREVIHEMEQGITGAQRSMRTAADNEERLRSEIDEQRRQASIWLMEARQHLSDNDEASARADLLRKHEVENLIAGLEMQLKAATATRTHLTTTYHALEARLADARRRLVALEAGQSPGQTDASLAGAAGKGGTAADRPVDLIDLELAALRRELDAGNP